jgi:hypothetical protein
VVDGLLLVCAKQEAGAEYCHIMISIPH